ncbi:MAG: biotin/lipoyl-binding protein [Methylothermaceae bacterium]|nr:biotin/lipoyl-binding protein [Methylothermaceae bacterium]
MKLPARRYWPWVVVLLGVLAFAVLILTRPRQEAPPIRPKVWLVQAIAVHPQKLRPILTLYGEVQTSRLMRAAAPGSSRVVEVPVKEGEAVEAGQLLVRLDSRDFQSKVVQAQADVDELAAQLRLERQTHASNQEALEHEAALLDLNRAAVARMEKLRRRNLAAQATLDQARMDLERQALAVTARRLEVEQHAARLAQIEARLMRAKAALTMAEVALERSQVSALFSGVVADLPVAPGDYVQANQELISVYPREQLEVRAKIPVPHQTEVFKALNRRDLLPAWGESLGTRFDLNLRRLAGQAEAGGIDALFELEGKEEKLRPGLPATVYLNLPPRPHAVAVPYSALYGSDRIYRIESGKLEAVQVTRLGDYRLPGGRTWLLVQSPTINAGDLVLTTHLPNVATGLPVKPQVVALPEEE